MCFYSKRGKKDNGKIKIPPNQHGAHQDDCFLFTLIKFQAVAFVHVVGHKTVQTDLPNIEIQKGHIY